MLRANLRPVPGLGLGLVYDCVIKMERTVMVKLDGAASCEKMGSKSAQVQHRWGIGNLQDPDHSSAHWERAECKQVQLKLCVV